MPIIVSGIQGNLDSAESEILAAAEKKLRIYGRQVNEAYILKSSLDARRKNNIHYVHSVYFDLDIDEEQAVRSLNNPLIQYKEKKTITFPIGNKQLKHPIIVAGFGPAGMFAALTLARNGYRPIVAERGADIDNREKAVQEFWMKGKLNPQSNVQFGEGGAGTFSDGKLTSRITDPLCEMVLKDFVRFGAPKEILRNSKPHIGTDKLRIIVKNIRKEIQRLGGQVLFNKRVDSFNFTSDKKLCSVVIDGEGIETENLLLAVGHSARDTFSMLYETGVYLEGKAFSVGARIEHLQADIDKSLYGIMAGHPLLPAGEYQLSYRENGRGVYTFCMCPGGAVVPAASEEGTVVTNGMSNYARDGKNANSALVVGVSPEDFGQHPLDGMHFQKQLEEKAFLFSGKNYEAPAVGVDEFLHNKVGISAKRLFPTYSIGVKVVDFTKIFSLKIINMMQKGLMQFDRKIKGFTCSEAMLTGVETRTSSPLRIKRGKDGQSISHQGIYPCGEGAGYAGGIMSAAVDGIKIAREIMSVYSPIK